MPDPADLQLYTAVYEGGLDFHVTDGHLVCKNEERGNQVFELKYIEPNLFILDENVQVEFEKDAVGSYSTLKMRWKNGGVTEKRKINLSAK
jgi:hypothetical protein